MDIFAHANETYLIIVDYHSDFFEVTKLVDQKSETTIKACKEQFARYGCPLIVQRRTRATVPQAERLLKPALQPAHQTMEGKTKKQRLSQHYYNRHDRDLSPIRKGTPVFVQSLKKYDPVKWSQGTIADRCSDRSYIVEIEGRLLRRNRRYLRNDATPTANNATPAEPTANNVVAGEVSLSNEPPEAVVEAE